MGIRVLIKHRAELSSTLRTVETENWSTTRFLLREDGVGLTLTDVTISVGSDAVYGYKHHIEVCYCLDGQATLEEMATGQIHQIQPGTLWVAAKGERFRFRAVAATRLISVFTPALVGPEVNDEEGSFPLL